MGVKRSDQEDVAWVYDNSHPNDYQRDGDPRPLGSVPGDEGYTPSDKTVFIKMLRQVEAGTLPAGAIIEWMDDEFIILYRP